MQTLSHQNHTPPVLTPTFAGRRGWLRTRWVSAAEQGEQLYKGPATLHADRSGRCPNPGCYHSPGALWDGNYSLAHLSSCTLGRVVAVNDLSSFEVACWASMIHSAAASELSNCYLRTQINAQRPLRQPLLSNQAGKILQFFFMIKTFKRTEQGRILGLDASSFSQGLLILFIYLRFFFFFPWSVSDSLRQCKSNLFIQSQSNFSFFSLSLSPRGKKQSSGSYFCTTVLVHVCPPSP